MFENALEGIKTKRGKWKKKVYPVGRKFFNKDKANKIRKEGR